MRVSKIRVDISGWSCKALLYSCAPPMMKTLCKLSLVDGSVERDCMADWRDVAWRTFSGRDLPYIISLVELIHRLHDIHSQFLTRLAGEYNVDPLF